jgi:hypothetical protein
MTVRTAVSRVSGASWQLVMVMIADVEDFFTKGGSRFAAQECSTRLWIDGLNELRRICRDAEL